MKCMVSIQKKVAVLSGGKKRGKEQSERWVGQLEEG